jgi:hypothetical protein
MGANVLPYIHAYTTYAAALAISQLVSTLCRGSGGLGATCTQVATAVLVSTSPRPWSPARLPVLLVARPRPVGSHAPPLLAVAASPRRSIEAAARRISTPDCAATQFAVTWCHLSYACAAATSLLSAARSNNHVTTVANLGLDEPSANRRCACARPSRGGPVDGRLDHHPAGKTGDPAGAANKRTHLAFEMSGAEKI